LGTLMDSNSTTSNPTTYATLTCTFNGTTLPASGGIDTVVSGTPTRNTQIAITATTDGSTNNYRSTGGNGGNQTVTVSVSNGKVTVSGAGIELVNLTAPADSSALSLNIIQLQ
jgi:hypothetical protein